MLNFLKAIFGGSDTKQTSTPVDMTPAEYKDLRGPFSDTLSSFLETGGPAYQGPLFSPETGNEQALRGNLMADAGGASGRQNYLTDVIGGKFLDPNNPILQDYIKSAQRPTMQALEETLSRTLPGRFAVGGQSVAPRGSSAFDRAAAIATRGAADAMGDIASKITYGAYEGERGRQQQAAQLSQAEVDTTIKNLQAQALPRLIQEVGIERGIQEFQRRTQALLEVMKLIGGVTAPTVANQSVGTSDNYGKGVFGTLFPQGLKLPG